MFLRTEVFNKVIASDLLMLWIIQRQSTFLTVLIAMSLILTLNMTIITCIILKVESMIKKPAVINYTVFTFRKINSFAYINSIVKRQL